MTGRLWKVKAVRFFFRYNLDACLNIRNFSNHNYVIRSPWQIITKILSTQHGKYGEKQNAAGRSWPAGYVGYPDNSRTGCYVLRLEHLLLWQHAVLWSRSFPNSDSKTFICPDIRAFEWLSVHSQFQSAKRIIEFYIVHRFVWTDVVIRQKSCYVLLLRKLPFSHILLFEPRGLGYNIGKFIFVLPKEMDSFMWQ